MLLWLKFIISAVVVVFCGYKLCVYADKIARITGLARGFVGFMLLAVVTSMPELAVTLGAVKLGAYDLALGDLFGSNLFNLTVIGVIFLRFTDKSRLLTIESTHFITSSFSVLLAALAGVGIIFYNLISSTGYSRFLLDAETALILAAYVFGAYLVSRNKPAEPTSPGSTSEKGVFLVWLKFLSYSALLVVAAIYVSHLGNEISQIQVAGVALGGTFVGSLFVAITTSLPEVVVAISAVKLGFWDMALGNIFGSNMLNMAIIGLADLSLGRRVILSLVSSQHLLTILFIIISTGIVCAGLTLRTRRKMPSLAWDSVALIFVYFTANLVNYFLR